MTAHVFMTGAGAADGVTFWGSHAKAAAELGFAPRGLEPGARDAYGDTLAP